MTHFNAEALRYDPQCDQHSPALAGIDYSYYPWNTSITCDFNEMQDFIVSSQLMKQLNLLMTCCNYTKGCALS